MSTNISIKLTESGQNTPPSKWHKSKRKQLKDYDGKANYLHGRTAVVDLVDAVAGRAAAQKRVNDAQA